MTEVFRERTAIVTGGGSGIGREAAVRFSHTGVFVVVVDADAVAGAESVREIEQGGGRAEFLRLDVTIEKEVASCVEHVMDRRGAIDFAFNNTGIEGARAATVDATENNWDRVLDINLKGVWLCMKHELSVMVKQMRGAIVNASSMAGLVGYRGLSAYSASTHAVIGLTKTAALEYAGSNIRVNAVCPGVIEPPMLSRQTDSRAVAARRLNALTPAGRIAQGKTADVVIWLCSDEASYVTGQAVAVDGGWTAQ